MVVGMAWHTPVHVFHRTQQSTTHKTPSVSLCLLIRLMLFTWQYTWINRQPSKGQPYSFTLSAVSWVMPTTLDLFTISRYLDIRRQCRVNTQQHTSDIQCLWRWYTYKIYLSYTDAMWICIQFGSIVYGYGTYTYKICLYIKSASITIA